jgi:hypothetical protein
MSDSATREAQRRGTPEEMNATKVDLETPRKDRFGQRAASAIIYVIKVLCRSPDEIPSMALIQKAALRPRTKRIPHAKRDTRL